VVVRKAWARRAMRSVEEADADDALGEADGGDEGGVSDSGSGST
jgi:hypothetical protein